MPRGGGVILALLATLVALSSAKLQVHLICHTHNDVGWLKTIDQYYYGANNTIQKAGVQYILDTVVQQLLADPARKFIYVETAFFARWWQQQTGETQRAVRMLREEGRLVFINGGWSMHDEANPHYAAMIDQTSYGHRFLKDNVGAIPRGGWQIDPFGHSGTQAALLSAETGFTSLYFARIDYQDREQRFASKRMETIWQGSPSYGDEARVFTGVFYHGTYCAPNGFNYDVESDDIPWKDDPNLEGYNVPERVEKFVKWVNEQAKGFQGDNIMLTMGCDFNYNNAAHWYKNLDKLIKYVNADGRVNTFYSDPNIYTEAKHKEDLSWPLKTDDFFPLRNKPHAFWTGYFTSRPAFKRFTRDCIKFHLVARQIAAVANITGQSKEYDTMIGAIGLAEHHDAITGTEKQHVVFDYARHLSDGRHQVMSVLSEPLNRIAGGTGTWAECRLLNESYCPQTMKMGTGSGSATVNVVAWNPSSQARTDYLRIPVSGPHVSVEHAGDHVTTQVVPSPFRTNNYGPGDGAPYTLVVEAQNIPPMGMLTFVLKDTKADVGSISPPKTVRQNSVKIENEYYSVMFEDGFLSSVTNVKDGVSAPIKQEWMYYRSHQFGKTQKSGAYIFRPHEQTPIAIGSPNITKVTGSTGDNVIEVVQEFSPWVSQTVRLYKGSPEIELEWTIGAIPIEDGWGKEVISRFSSDIASEGEWAVDSNGRDMEYRKRNWRESFNFTTEEPVASNYYPTTTGSTLRDATRQMVVLTETSQASGSIQDGALEFLSHRRCLFDDGYGVGEPLNETEHITPYDTPCPTQGCGHHYGPGLIHRSKHYLILTSSSKGNETWRPAADRIFYASHSFFSTDSSPVVHHWQSLASALPKNVQILTLERKNTTSVLLRVAHQFGKGEDPVYSKPVQIDLAKLFALPGMFFVSATELTLSANQPKSSFVPYHWKIQGQTSPKPARKILEYGQSMITLDPMHIRTFEVSVH